MSLVRSFLLVNLQVYLQSLLTNPLLNKSIRTENDLIVRDRVRTERHGGERQRFQCLFYSLEMLALAP